MDVVDDVRASVRSIDPVDEREASDRDRALAWLTSTDDVFRRQKPDVPSPHLVSYVVVLDEARTSSYLVDHRIAGLALPPGGHVEPGEPPVTAARRELREELALDVPLDDDQPAFVSWTTTVGQDAGHIDVTLWFTVTVPTGVEPILDPSEFFGGRWWTFDEIAAVPAVGVVEPELSRFLATLGGAARPSPTVGR